MGTLTTAAVIDRASKLLQDPDNIRWPTAELLLWIADAQREIATYKPDAFVVTANLNLVAGTKQSLPANGTNLIDVVRNVSTGRAPRIVSREILDAQMPTWHSGTQNAEVKHYVFDPANQKAFYVQPPNTGTGSLEIVYAAAPGEVTLGGNLTLDDTWVPQITNYVMYRAYSKDAEYTANASLAVAYYQAFIGQMTGRANAEVMHDPNRNSPIVNPNLRQVANPNPPLQG